MSSQPPDPYNQQYNPQQPYGQPQYGQTGQEPYSQPGYSQDPYSQGYGPVPYGQPTSPYGQPAQPYGQPLPSYAQPQQFVMTGATGDQRDWLVTLLLCIFVGWIGVHRFYTGHTVIGIVQLLTLGGCGIWTLVDFILILTNSYTDSAGRPLRRA